MLELEVQLADRNVTLELTPAANGWLAEKGYDRQFGARPLARVIQENIKKPLADELLFGKLAKGGHVKIGVKNDELTFDIAEGEPAKIRPRSERPKKKSGSKGGAKSTEKTPGH